MGQVWDYAHGRDERAVAPSQLRKSVGAEINYAVRLDTVGDADKFVDELAGIGVCFVGATSVQGNLLFATRY